MAAEVRRSLRRLHEACTRPFEDAFSAYNAALEREDAALAALGALERQVAGSGALGRTVRSGPPSPVKANAAASPSAETTRHRVAELQSALRANESSRAALEAEVRARDDRLRTLATHAEATDAAMAERNVLVEILQDELQALQLELLRSDERLRAVEAENRALLQTDAAPPLAPERVLSLGTTVRQVCAFESHALLLTASHIMRIEYSDADVRPLLCPVPSAALAVSLPDGIAYVCDAERDRIFIADALGAQRSAVERAGDAVVSLCPAASSRIIAAHASGILCLYDAGVRARLLWTECLPQAARTALSLGRDSALLAVLSDGRAGPSLALWDTSARRVIGRAPPSVVSSDCIICAAHMPSQAHRDADGGYSEPGSLLAVVRDRQIHAYCANARGLHTQWSREQADIARPQHAAISARGAVAVASGHALAVFPSATEAARRAAVQGAPIAGIAFLGDALLVAQCDGRISFYTLFS